MNHAALRARSERVCTGWCCRTNGHDRWRCIELKVIKHLMKRDFNLDGNRNIQQTINNHDITSSYGSKASPLTLITVLASTMNIISTAYKTLKKDAQISCNTKMYLKRHSSCLVELYTTVSTGSYTFINCNLHTSPTITYSTQGTSVCTHPQATH